MNRMTTSLHEQPATRLHDTPNQSHHSVAWLVWLCATLAAVIATRNPLYLTLILLCLFIVTATLRTRSSDATPLLISPAWFALIVITLSSLMNSLTTHHGRTVLFHLPPSLPLVGGNITLEAVSFGLINGLVLSCLFAAFTVFNMALPIRAIIRFIPRAFYPLAVVTTIAVTFVPTTLRQLQHIREAQAVRGHRLRGIRDWLPLFMPLLIGGLEHALQLAEAMTARGFASTGEHVYDTRVRAAIVAGLIALPGGLLLRVGWGNTATSLVLMLAGGGLLVGALWVVGRRVPHTRYRREHWTPRDTLVLVGAVLVGATFLSLLPGIDRKALYYSPYPVVHLPVFQPAVALACLGVLLPALLMPPSPQQSQDKETL